ncbi:MAG: hypothetical protein JNM81_17240 [Rhodospirillaceae bacterium]|nr:hypothetical protein [Rhodospirillaceae bacterium]
MSHTLLPELKETDATGRIAEIYADLRASLGVPMVNLIFRHLATVPGCLEWVWEQVGPLYVSGAFTHAASAVTTQQQIPVLTFSRTALGHCGLNDSAIEAIRQTCTAYARANPANLMGLQALETILQGLALDPPLTYVPATNARPAPQAGVTAVTPLLPMGNLQMLAADTFATLRALALQVHGEDGPVIPSFYRHFIAWPAFLSLLHEHLEPLMAPVNAAVQGFEHASKASALTLLRGDGSQAVKQPNAITIEALQSVIARFPQNLIRMTLIPLAISAALQSAA